MVRRRKARRAGVLRVADAVLGAVATAIQHFEMCDIGIVEIDDEHVIAATAAVSENECAPGNRSSRRTTAARAFGRTEKLDQVRALGGFEVVKRF